jgi:hypothetical protein
VPFHCWAGQELYTRSSKSSQRLAEMLLSRMVRKDHSHPKDGGSTRCQSAAITAEAPVIIETRPCACMPRTSWMERKDQKAAHGWLILVDHRSRLRRKTGGRAASQDVHELETLARQHRGHRSPQLLYLKALALAKTSRATPSNDRTVCSQV